MKAIEKLENIIGKFGVNDEKALNYEELEAYYKRVILSAILASIS